MWRGTSPFSALRQRDMLATIVPGAGTRPHLQRVIEAGLPFHPAPPRSPAQFGL